MLYRGGHLYVCPRLVSRCICSSRVDPSSSMSQSISFFFLFPSISFIWAKLTILYIFFLSSSSFFVLYVHFLLFHHAKRTTTSLAYALDFSRTFLLNGKWLDWHSHLYFLGVHPSVFNKLWPCNKKRKFALLLHSVLIKCYVCNV